MTRLKLYAKIILENRFWILESNGEKIGTICKQEDRRYSSVVNKELDCMIINPIGKKFYRRLVRGTTLSASQ